MNKQRSRRYSNEIALNKFRFRTAKQSEEDKKAAIKKGILLPDEAAFDSNCITPGIIISTSSYLLGTTFMIKLNEQLKYFCHKKVSEDSQWQGVEIILSGHEVPGVCLLISQSHSS
jgi:5'-3' exoribonuclease 1